MISGAEGRFSSTVATSRLESVFSEIASEIESGNLGRAIRLADSACRFAPGNPTCLTLHARLLMQIGENAEAISLLSRLDEPEAIVLRGEAFCMAGLFDSAAVSVERLLHSFAVDTVSGLSRVAGKLTRVSGSPGWLGVDASLRVIGEIRNDLPIRVRCDGATFRPKARVTGKDGYSSFELEIPRGVSGILETLQGERCMLGSGLVWPPDFGFSGWVMAQNNALKGKATLRWAPARPLMLAIGWPGSDLQLSVESGAGEFSVPLPGFEKADQVTVSVILPDGRRSALLGSPVRRQLVSPAPIGPRPVRTVLPPQPRSEQVVDVVIPVYGGLAETLACLDRVLATTTRSAAALVVINDATPDMELCRALNDLALQGCITLLTNPVNLGFPGSCNRGMNLHPDRDVVLLNSDAEVFGDWLDRLQSVAYSAGDIGTVTPLGQDASIMSYPGGAETQQALFPASEIDCVARQVNGGNTVELPVGVGFCLYIKRSCIDEVGVFDEYSFATGYGEENDFCLRARARGWRHVGAPGLFVGHPGKLSYGRLRQMLMERNHLVLNSLYPGYDDLVADFLTADPLRETRRQIDAGLLLQRSTAPVLFVSSDVPGGVARFTTERQSEVTAAGYSALILHSAASTLRTSQVQLSTQNPDLRNLVYDIPEETHLLRNLLTGLQLSRVEIHHFKGLPDAALELVTALEVPIVVYVHDYAWICPRMNLVGGDGSYCGEPPVEDCEICARTYGTELEEALSVAALRSRSASWLARASEVIVPSKDVRNRLARYFSDVPMRVLGWEALVTLQPSPPIAPDVRVRVAVIGAISIQKGYRVLLECARDAAERNLSLEFVVIGYTLDDRPLRDTKRVFITGPYQEGEVGPLLAREGCRIAFFPAVAPETWCYALTHALEHGLPIVAFDIGAIAERLRGCPTAQLLPHDTDPASLNDGFTEFARRITTSQRIKESI